MLPILFPKCDLHLLPYLCDHILTQETELVVKVRGKTVLLGCRIIKPTAWSEEGFLRGELEFISSREDRYLTKVHMVIIMSTSWTVEQFVPRSRSRMIDNKLNFHGDGTNARVRRVKEGIDDRWIFGKLGIWRSLVDR